MDEAIRFNVVFKTCKNWAACNLRIMDKLKPKLSFGFY
jgi:hypothetical protein